MVNIIRATLSGLPLLALPALAAAPAATTGVATGITGIRPAIFLFAIAAALIATLLLRSTVSHFTRTLADRVNRLRARRRLDRVGSNVMHDVLLPGAYGGLARIDHALMTAGGILCIRTIHQSGIVFGEEDEAQWTCVDGATRRRFLNPLIQNEGRTRAIRQVVPDVPVANLVIFTGKVEFTAPPPKNVITMDRLDGFIQKFIFGPSKVEDWDAAWLSLKSAALTDEASRRDFAAQLGFS